MTPAVLSYSCGFVLFVVSLFFGGTLSVVRGRCIASPARRASEADLGSLRSPGAVAESSSEFPNQHIRLSLSLSGRFAFLRSGEGMRRMWLIPSAEAPRRILLGHL